MASRTLKTFSMRTISLLRTKPRQLELRGATVTHFLRRSFAASSDTSPTQTDPALKLSESCVKKLAEICKDETYLRVQVDGGGCSGFQYKFELVSELNEDDIKFGPDGRVVIDSISLDYCAGATLDYQVELIKSGFRMTSNPKAEQGCSCGASFALKM